MRQRVVRTIVPAIAIAVAGFQLFQARANDQVAWEGGGFGMFATIDAAENRQLQADPSVTLQPSATLSRALTHPAQLDELADEVAAVLDGPVSLRLLRIAYDDRTITYEVIGEAAAIP